MIEQSYSFVEVQSWVSNRVLLLVLMGRIALVDDNVSHDLAQTMGKLTVLCVLERCHWALNSGSKVDVIVSDIQPSRPVVGFLSIYRGILLMQCHTLIEAQAPTV